MNANFSRALELVLQSEGGFVNDPRDPGGATNLGVTIGKARELGLDLDHDGDVDVIDIKLLKPADAAKVYRHYYWDVIRGDDLPAGVDYAVFDFAVNSGTGRAAKTLQSIVGSPADGAIGPNTLAAVRGKPAALTIGLLCDERQHFLERLPAFATFGKGWTARVARVRVAALGMVA